MDGTMEWLVKKALWAVMHVGVVVIVMAIGFGIIGSEKIDEILPIGWAAPIVLGLVAFIAVISLRVKPEFEI